MPQKKSTKPIYSVLTIVLNIILFVAVIFLMNSVRSLLYSDAKINLQEVVTQNKDVITSKLQLELNSLEMVASQLVDNLKGQGLSPTPTNFQNVFLSYGNRNQDSSLFIAQLSGDAMFIDGRELSIAGRKYFTLSAAGTANISDRVVSRLNGQEIFIISVPVLSDGQIIGTVQKMYSPEEIYALCSISLFSSQGYMHIVNSEGYILISSSEEALSSENENYFRTIYAKGNQEQSKTLEDDIQNNRAGFMETVIDGKKVFSAYTPIEEIHDWFLITSVSTAAVSSNANTVIKMFYIILSAVVVIFAVSMGYFLSYKNKQQSSLEEVAFLDPVTHGHTYVKFVVEMEKTLAANPDIQFSLLAFDIDNFKYINNFYGFDEGDNILRAIFNTVSSQLLPRELLCRVSGDHFLALVEDSASTRINVILDSVQKCAQYTIYASGGLYPITDRTESANLMMDKATTAAQAVKGVLHKKVEPYSDKYEKQMIENEQTKRLIEQALADDELVPFYQPKVYINTEALAGAEVLARWQKKDGTIVPPSEFIPMCERTGLITELDMVIFDKALRFIKENLDKGVRCVPISVNFSRLHLSDPEFAGHIMAKINQYEIPPSLIEVELTENVIMDNHDVVYDFINQLHDHGVLMSMDDFGSGYSSLNMLKDLPIDVIKIDRGFLKETSDSNRKRIIFSAIVQMARKLEMKIVVEGVETEENLQLMRDNGCYIAQGFYFSKPVDEQSFQKYYKIGRLS